MSSSDDGLNTKIKAVMEPMINALLITTPENPVFFMIQWLKTFNNANPSFLDKEREEFEKLKYELETYQRAKIEIPKSTNLLDFSERFMFYFKYYILCCDIEQEQENEEYTKIEDIESFY